MNESEPTLGTDDCEGHVIVWTYPALDIDRRRRDLPVPDDEVPTQRGSTPVPAAESVARPAASKAKRRWVELSG
jgi:hypothetical protein